MSDLAMICDAHLPSMTARFRIPPGLPFSAGIYSLKFLRTPTEQDKALWAHLPEPPDELEVLDCLEEMVAAFSVSATTRRQLDALKRAREAMEAA